MKKTNATRTKNNVPTGAETNYIEETLKFVESEEMREHLHKWLTSGSVRNVIDLCAEIVVHAPVHIERKLPILKLLMENATKDCDLSNDNISGDIVWEFEEAIYEQHWYYEDGQDNPAGTMYKLRMYGVSHGEEKDFQFFDEATQHLHSSIQQNTSNSNETSCIKNLKQDGVHVIEKWVPDSRESGIKLWIKWFLNNAGDILYFYMPSTNNDILCAVPGRPKYMVPFQPGDIVTTDCSPFGMEKKVLILENNDTFDSVNSDGVTCLFLNDSNNIEIGYFKSNEFLNNPELTHVSALYRAKTYTGELSESEAPLKVIGAVIKDIPEIGRKIFRHLHIFRIPMSAFPRDIGSIEYNRYGVSWKFFKKEFGLR